MTPPDTAPDPLRGADLAPLLDRERRRYLDDTPRSRELARQAAAHWLFGVPMHWMRDWPLPHPLHVSHAEGHRVTDVDGRERLDFCLGDTGAMFGHAPAPIARALAGQATHGLTTMLPGAAAADVGRRLAACFGLPRWQLALSATDANRFVLRWARAATGRPKVLVFDGCYHGTVDDALVDLRTDADGVHHAVTRASLLGQVHDLAAGTRVVPFNDIDAVREALAAGDVAAVLTEPALTNCGLVPPRPGFLQALQAACREAGTLLVIDETHTVSAAWGGMARAEGLFPDALVVGKAVAGGVPCAAYGVTEALARRLQAAREAAPDGHSGIGTTLAGSLLSLAALRATLAELMTPAVYDAMRPVADHLERRLLGLIADQGLPWSVARLGVRMELQFRPTPPASAAEARAAMHPALEAALHLYLLNRGLLLTPFHTMMLIAPTTTAADADRLVDAIGRFVDELWPREAR